MKSGAIALVVLAATLLAACGGGTGGTNSFSLRVDAGADRSADEGATVSLSGSATGGASITAYSWTQIGGPLVTLNTAASNQASFAAPTLTSSATFTFRLSATGSAAKSASDEVAVTVNPVNASPVANAGDDLTVDARTGAAITGPGSDEEGQIASFAWSQTSEPGVTIGGMDSVQIGLTAPIVTDAATLVFRLTVTDNEGATATDDVSVTVNPMPNRDPTAHAGADQSVESTAVAALGGSGSDSDGAIASHGRTQTGGTAVTVTDADTSAPSFTAPVVTGTQPFTFRLPVTDNEGATATDDVTVTINPIGADGSDWNSMVRGQGSWG